MLIQHGGILWTVHGKAALFFWGLHNCSKPSKHVCVSVCVPYPMRSVSSWSWVGLFYNFSLSPPTCKSGWTSGPRVLVYFLYHKCVHKCGDVVQKCIDSSLVVPSLSSRCLYFLKIYRNFPLFHVNCHYNVCTFVLASMMWLVGQQVLVV